MQSPCLPPDINLKPRVFVRQDGGDYVEIPDIESFERQDDAGAGARISFVVAEAQKSIANHALLNGADKHLEVKIEFSLGMLMVMKFSGAVESISGNKVSFAVSSEITTDVIENPATSLHYH